MLIVYLKSLESKFYPDPKILFDKAVNNIKLLLHKFLKNQTKILNIFY